MSNIEEIKEVISQNFNTDVAASMDVVLQVNLKDGGQYQLHIKNGTFNLEQGVHDSPSLTMTTDEKTLRGIIDGSINGMQAFMMGKIKFAGDMGLAMKLKNLFE